MHAEIENGINNLEQGGERKNGTTYDQALWSLFVLISRKLQVSSASIKASVSSLLDYNIFWDGSSQHEFLESINTSTNQITKLITLVSLASRAQAGSLTLKPEPQMLQEIVSVAVDQMKKAGASFDPKVNLSSSNKTVLVDYEYFLLALKLMFEILIDMDCPIGSVQVSVKETEECYQFSLIGNPPCLKKYHLLENDRIVDLLLDRSISPENRLKFFVVYQIILQQGFIPKAAEITDDQSGICFRIPFAAGIKNTPKR